ncbi:MAG: nitrous oxide reductase family maturation protein NosD [Deltaproteobacteria bacterium]|nr:nitrous oxide reductase family maturation protein NosD [Deltaproteobacteria bacterium]
MVHYILVLALLTAISALEVMSAETVHTVSPKGPFTSISLAILSAKSGDTVEVNSGTYNEHIIVDKTLDIIGINEPNIDGGGKGTVVLIKAPGVTFKGFRVTGSGESLTVEDAGIVLDSAQDSIIEDNRLHDVLFGIYLKNSSGTLIRNNIIVGKDLSIPVRGDGIRLWYSSDTKIIDNTITGARDLVMWWSGDTLIKGNKIEQGRYGLHYMYSDNNVFEDNLFIDNYVGGFLMYSKNIKFHYNIFARNQGPATGYGIGFKDLDDIVAKENLFIDNRIGIYMDNSPHSIDSWNTLEDNVIAFNDIGISLMPSIQRNIIVSNSFADNSQQVEVRGGGTLSGNNWYAEGKGNYWSDYVGYDDNKDGIGEIPYKAESLFESLIDSYPNLRVFVFSPVAQAIELASDAFPVIKPEPKVTDEYPLMKFEMPRGYGEEEHAFSYKLFVLSLFMILIPVFSYLFIIRRAR